jgi:antirestriction protein
MEDMTPTQQEQQEQDIANLCEEHGIDEHAFNLYCGNHHITKNHEDHVDSFIDSYRGCYDNFLDFATQLFDETMDVPDHLAFYIDYEAWARDLSHDYWEELGHVFLSI